jgi:hypothetical protein
MKLSVTVATYGNKINISINEMNNSSKCYREDNTSEVKCV